MFHDSLFFPCRQLSLGAVRRHSGRAGAHGLRNVYSAKGEVDEAETAILSGDVSVTASVMLEYQIR